VAADRARAAAAIEDFLRALGRDPGSESDLAETGRLVADAYADDLLSGYAMDPAEILADSVSEVGGDVVALRDVETTIMCPHHLMPAGGVVHLAYAPAGRVVGLGALGRLVDCFAHRLILQETFVQAIADALCEHLGARGAGCVAELSPACLTARGERRHGALVSTVATAGQMRPGEPLHATFLHCVGGAGR
jgi:GTP cyclohydrolase I